MQTEMQVVFIISVKEFPFIRSPEGIQCPRGFTAPTERNRSYAGLVIMYSYNDLLPANLKA